jgi:hypothetical protein
MKAVFRTNSETTKMIVKVLYSKSANRIYFTSKPSHNGRDREHSVDFESEPTHELFMKLQGKDFAFFHAHMKEDTLVLDDKIDDQHW